jgi:A/G-specific adenine glycosylase
VQNDCIALLSNRVAELPTPRARKAVPEKHSTFLLLMHDNKIYLEKREPQGIWGGLWSTPQIEDGNGVIADYLQRNELEVTERVELKALTHTFTHFKLHITPVLLKVELKPLRVQQLESVWLSVEEALTIGIPTPVRRLLEQLP